jgi:hypothetical protein
MILNKFFDFLSSLKLEPQLEAAVKEATYVMIESINGMIFYKEDKTVLPLQANRNVFTTDHLKDMAEINKKQFKKFVENVSKITGQKMAIIEAFDALVEMYSWTPSDAAQTYSVGGSAGAEVLQAGIRPLWDMYDPFKIATGTTDAPVDQGAAPMGFGQTPVTSSKDDGKSYNFPSIKMNSSNDVKKIMGNAMNRIPHDKENAAFSPWWQYNNFQNSNNYF